MKLTDKEKEVVKRACKAMLARANANLEKPDPTWTQVDIRDIQYDIVLLQSAIAKLN